MAHGDYGYDGENLRREPMIVRDVGDALAEIEAFVHDRPPCALVSEEARAIARMAPKLFGCADLFDKTELPAAVGDLACSRHRSGQGGAAGDRGDLPRDWCLSALHASGDVGPSSISLP